MKYGLTVCCVGDLNLETVISDLYNRVWNGINVINFSKKQKS